MKKMLVLGWCLFLLSAVAQAQGPSDPNIVFDVEQTVITPAEDEREDYARWQDRCVVRGDVTNNHGRIVHLISTRTWSHKEGEFTGGGFYPPGMKLPFEIWAKAGDPGDEFLDLPGKITCHLIVKRRIYDPPNEPRDVIVFFRRNVYVQKNEKHRAR